MSERGSDDRNSSAAVLAVGQLRTLVHRLAEERGERLGALAVAGEPAARAEREALVHAQSVALRALGHRIETVLRSLGARFSSAAPFLAGALMRTTGLPSGVWTASSDRAGSRRRSAPRTVRVTYGKVERDRASQAPTLPREPDGRRCRSGATARVYETGARRLVTPPV